MCKKKQEATEEDNKEEEATAIVAAAKETSVDGAAAALLSELDGIFAQRDSQKEALQAFFSVGKMFSLLTGSIVSKKKI